MLGPPDITISMEQYETEKAAIIADQFHMEMSLEFITDLTNTSERITKPETEFVATIQEVLTKSKDGIKANFIVASSEMNVFLEEANIDTRTIVNPFYYRNVVLIGHKEREDEIPRGYVFSPYTSFIMTTAIMNPNTFHVDRRLMTRYTKRMFNKELYTSVVIKNDNK